MADSIDEQLVSDIQEIAHTWGWGYMLTGTVKNVNADAGTIDVELRNDDTTTLQEGVRINLGAELGVKMIPENGAKCLIAQVDNKDGFWELVKASKYSRIVIGGGENDGLVKVGPLVDEINAIKSDINALKNIFNSWVVAPTDGGGALWALLTTWKTDLLPDTLQETIENTDIKH